MSGNRTFRLFALLVSITACPCLLASGLFWDFLGHTQINASQDHCTIQIVRPDLPYRTIQMRLSGEAVFLDRLVLHFDRQASQVIHVNGRISPEEKSYMIDLTQEGRTVESVELWYYKEPWERPPSLSLYGLRIETAAGKSTTEEQ